MICAFCDITEGRSDCMEPLVLYRRQWSHLVLQLRLLRTRLFVRSSSTNRVRRLWIFFSVFNSASEKKNTTLAKTSRHTRSYTSSSHWTVAGRKHIDFNSRNTQTHVVTIYMCRGRPLVAEEHITVRMQNRSPTFLSLLFVFFFVFAAW